VSLHAAASNTNRAPTIEDVGHLPRIAPSLPHPFRLTRTYALPMGMRATDRLPGSAPAMIASVITLVTVVLYVALIVSQGDVDIAGMIAIAAYLAGLGVCALAGAVRTLPDRVIPLGVASGGLIGAAIISLFSIGLLLLVAGIFALVAWMRAGVGASRRDQLLGGMGGVVAAFGFLAVSLLF
jgi:hypothetical protein